MAHEKKPKAKLPQNFWIPVEPAPPLFSEGGHFFKFPFNNVGKNTTFVFFQKLSVMQN